jgi:hypothetical protein
MAGEMEARVYRGDTIVTNARGLPLLSIEERKRVRRSINAPARFWLLP